MKLTKLHLFLLIIVVLLLSTLGFSVKEYFESGSHSHKEEESDSVKDLLKHSKDKALDFNPLLFT